MLTLSNQYKKGSHVALMISDGENDQTGQDFKKMIDTLNADLNIAKVTIIYCDTLHRHKYRFINQHNKILSDDEALKEAQESSKKWHNDEINMEAIASLRKNKGEGNVCLLTWDHYRNSSEFTKAEDIIKALIENGIDGSKSNGQQNHKKKKHENPKHILDGQVTNFARKTEAKLQKLGITGWDYDDVYNAEAASLLEKGIVRYLMMQDETRRFHGEIYPKPLNKFLQLIHDSFGKPDQMHPSYFVEKKLTSYASSSMIFGDPKPIVNYYYYTVNINQSNACENEKKITLSTDGVDLKQMLILSMIALFSNNDIKISIDQYRQIMSILNDEPVDNHLGEDNDQRSFKRRPAI